MYDEATCKKEVWSRYSRCIIYYNILIMLFFTAAGMNIYLCNREKIVKTINTF